MTPPKDRNVLGTALEPCSVSPPTGFLRNGDCRMPAGDAGRHGICARVTAAFLDFTKRRGNDLSTPQPAFGFPGLKPGDRWCLCIDRWLEAAARGLAPPVILEATHADVAAEVPVDRLKRHSAEDGRANESY
jgi:uncharacterized protein (DUF2237 family)